MKTYLTAQEVTAILKISRATLYSYVSRGLIRSEATGEDSRVRRYAAEDVYALQARKRDPAHAAQEALHWGMPILESALTLIHDHHLYYRGQDALRLAVENTVEEVAALLWTGDINQANALFAETTPLISALPPDLPPLQRLQLALVLANDLAAYDLSPEGVCKTGARILKLMTQHLTSPFLQNTVGAQHVAPLQIAQCLVEVWCPELPHALPLLNAALILCADHELNVSAFTARVVASSEATPYAVVLAGLQALSGFKHGGNTQRVEALWREVGEPRFAAQVLADRLRRGERIPGFGHRLYPEGDPRYHLLIGLLTEYYPTAPDVQLALSVVEAMQQIKAAIPPNIDFALVTLRRVLQLPPEGALVIFALGRTIGWLAHALEQYKTGELIRPRAKYVGEMPRSQGD